MKQRERLEQLLQSGMQYLQRGLHLEAESIFAAVLDEKPAHPYATHYRGMALAGAGNIDQALRWVEKSVRLEQSNATFHTNYACLLLDHGNLDSAGHHARRALALNPRLISALCVDGWVAFRQRQFSICIDRFQAAGALGHDSVEDHCAVVTSLFNVGRTEEAIGHANALVARHPEDPNAFARRTLLLHETRDHEAALASAKRDFSRFPHSLNVAANLAITLAAAGQIDEALAQYKHAIGKFSYNHALQVQMASALGRNWLFDECRLAFETALRNDPDATSIAWSEYLLQLLYDPTVSREDIEAAHQRFGQQLQQQHRTAPRISRPCAQPLRKLRIGYVSGDIRSHPVGYFLYPVLTAHDRTAFDVYAYNTSPLSDLYTEKIRRAVHVLRDCHAMNDEALLRQIRADEIDILVDLSGHTAYNRLGVFARRGAPVQMTWLGYPSDTGVTAIDFRISTYDTDPDVSDKSSERLVYLERGTDAFEHPANAPAPNPLPAAATGYVTFGSFNAFRKLNPALVGAWCQILSQLPTARLVIGNISSAHEEPLLRRAFESHKVSLDRVRFQPRQSLHDFLAAHHDIDIALDSFPYNGGTTTYHSLWMGVPVISCVADRTAGRVGLSILNSVGLADFTARNADEYVKIATSIPQDLDRLARLRGSLRAEMAANPKLQPSAVAASLEKIYRDAWKSYCEAESDAQGTRQIA
jgi:predicted O-linked N-acetylglucosamine transferase (SPINDLY family)